MSGPTRWTRVRKGVWTTAKLLALVVALYLVVGFVAIRTGSDPVDLSLGGDPAPAPSPPAAEVRQTLVRGAISVHTGRSHDAEGTFDEVAEAGAATGLDFVVLGDHVGDWADEGDGFLSIVHPRSSRGRERWNGLGVSGIDAWESFDVSEMARMRQNEALVGYRIAGILASMATGRGHESIARFWKEGTETPALLAYDSVRASTPMVLTGGLNHHPKARVLGHLIPAYGTFFRTVVNHVMLPEPLVDDPFRARAQLLDALRSGRLFVTLGDGNEILDFDFWAVDGGGSAMVMGARGPWTGSGVLGIRVPSEAGRTVVRVLRDGGEVAWLDARGGEVLGWDVPGPGSYRVELFKAGWKVGGLRFGFRPWIVSNPVELRGDPVSPASGEARGGSPEVVGDPGSPEG